MLALLALLVLLVAAARALPNVCLPPALRPARLPLLHVLTPRRRPVEMCARVVLSLPCPFWAVRVRATLLRGLSWARQVALTRLLLRAAILPAVLVVAVPVVRPRLPLRHVLAPRRRPGVMRARVALSLPRPFWAMRVRATLLRGLSWARHVALVRPLLRMGVMLVVLVVTVPALTLLTLRLSLLWPPHLWPIPPRLRRPPRHLRPARTACLPPPRRGRLRPPSLRPLLLLPPPVRPASTPTHPLPPLAAPPWLTAPPPTRCKPLSMPPPPPPPLPAMARMARLL